MRNAGAGPGSSVTTSERILDDAGDVLVEAEFGIVLWNAEERGSRPMTDQELVSLGQGLEMKRT